MIGLYFQYGIILQVIAIVHFMRRRPDGYWLWIILIGGGLGALAYFVAEVIPDAGLLRGTFQVFPRRKRIKELRTAILDNPSIANYEELGHLYLDDGQFGQARESFDRVISARTDSPDPFYRRALAAIAMEDFQAAAADLEQVIKRDPKFDSWRAPGLYAHALGKIGRLEEADAIFADVTQTATFSEVQYNYACFLAGVGRTAEAREWAMRILAKKPTMPAYVRRQERPWFRKAAALIKTVNRQPVVTATSQRPPA